MKKSNSLIPLEGLDKKFLIKINKKVKYSFCEKELGLDQISNILKLSDASPKQEIVSSN